MERSVFMGKLNNINNCMGEEELKAFVRDTARNREEDVSICIGELSELILELTRFQRGKFSMEDFLQEISHVQWAVWNLQNAFGVSDEMLYKAVQASFRSDN